MGNGGEGGVEDGRNGEVERYAVQGSSEVGVVIREEELGGDRDHAQSYRGILSSVSKKKYGDDGATYN